MNHQKNIVRSPILLPNSNWEVAKSNIPIHKFNPQETMSDLAILFRSSLREHQQLIIKNTLSHTLLVEANEGILKQISIAVIGHLLESTQIGSVTLTLDHKLDNNDNTIRFLIESDGIRTTNEEQWFFSAQSNTQSQPNQFASLTMYKTLIESMGGHIGHNITENSSAFAIILKYENIDTFPLPPNNETNAQLSRYSCITPNVDALVERVRFDIIL